MVSEKFLMFANMIIWILIGVIISEISSLMEEIDVQKRKKNIIKN